MRFYSFSNMYLSSIQVGLQSGHVIAEMFMKYLSPAHNEEKHEILVEWAKQYKTMILLNAGYGENIHSLSEFFDNRENPYPWAEFYEGQDALDGALTCAGIILPEKIYEGVAALRIAPIVSEILQKTGTINLFYRTEKERKEEYTKWEAQLMRKLTTFGLAK